MSRIDKLIEAYNNQDPFHTIAEFCNFNFVMTDIKQGNHLQHVLSTLCWVNYTSIKGCTGCLASKTKFEGLPYLYQLIGDVECLE